MNARQPTNGDKTMTKRIEWHTNNRQYRIKYSDGVTRVVEATRSDELREKALQYYKLRNGEVDWHYEEV